MNKSHKQNIKLRVKKSCQETKSKLSEPVCEYKAEKKQTIKDSDSKWESASGIHKRIGQDVSQTVNQMPTQPEQKLEKP